MEIKIIGSTEFDSYWEGMAFRTEDAKTTEAVREIIAAVRNERDAAVRRFTASFDKSSPESFEVSLTAARQAYDALCANDESLAEALELAADHIRRFAFKQKEQFTSFEYEMDSGLFTGQRVIAVERAAVYVPAGRFPLVSTVLMGLVPAFCAGVKEVILASPPLKDGLPDRSILAAAIIADNAVHGKKTLVEKSGLRVFAIGGAQAIAALALGTETVPKVDLIAGPGNKYVAAAKRLLFGEVGIDFVAGPTDVLIIADGNGSGVQDAGGNMRAADLIAADMIAQAEHDPDARACALVSTRELAEQTTAALERRLAALPDAETARASLTAGGLIIVYGDSYAEAVRIANVIAPEHLELQITNPEKWIPCLKNYGSLFIGALSAEALGDYSAGINHTLPTSGSARYTGGLSVRHFLKTVTTLRCASGGGFERAREAAEIIACAEGLTGHAQSVAARKQ